MVSGPISRTTDPWGILPPRCAPHSVDPSHPTLIMADGGSADGRLPSAEAKGGNSLSIILPFLTQLATFGGGDVTVVRRLRCGVSHALCQSYCVFVIMSVVSTSYYSR